MRKIKCPNSGVYLNSGSCSSVEMDGSPWCSLCKGTHFVEAPDIKVYVASSWRNARYPEVVRRLAAVPGLDVYDFRANAFGWREIDPDWEHWTPDQTRKNLDHPLARAAFACDEVAVREASATLLVLPCGRSAHLELGVAVGRGQRCAVFMPQPTEPELMYRWVTILTTWDEVETWGKSL